ncbi:MAG: hypothetical protein JWO52_3330 [Gammaproteobacteria bacterium]|nr:hypothetical protein [Gammaproteobacteria bacterium]
MIDGKNPFEQSFDIALYKSMVSGTSYVSHFYGDRDATFHGDYVRISEPISVRFTKLADEIAIRNAIAILDEQERKAYDDLTKTLERIKEQKSSLLALTYAPEAA